MPTVKNWYSEKRGQTVLSEDDIEIRLDKLKKLKFARTLSRGLTSEIPTFKAASTFLIEKGGIIDVFLLYDESTRTAASQPKSEVENAMLNLLGKKELKTFGLKVNPHLQSTQEFIVAMKDSLTSMPLWLYKRHHMFESSITFDDWVAKHPDDRWQETYSMGTSPPIISNIDIYQKEVDLSKPSASQ